MGDWETGSLFHIQSEEEEAKKQTMGADGAPAENQSAEPLSFAPEPAPAAAAENTPAAAAENAPAAAAEAAPEIAPKPEPAPPSLSSGKDEKSGKAAGTSLQLSGSSKKISFCHPPRVGTVKCSKCGNYICEECSKIFSFPEVKKGKTPVICGKCCEDMARQNVEAQLGDRNEVKGMLIPFAAGMLVGLVLFLLIGAPNKFFGFSIPTRLLLGILNMLLIGLIGLQWKDFIHSCGDIIKGCLSDLSLDFAYETIPKKIYYVIKYVVKMIVFLIFTVFLVAGKSALMLLSTLKKGKSIHEAEKSENEKLQMIKGYMQFQTAFLSQNEEGSMNMDETPYVLALRAQGKEAADALVHSTALEVYENSAKS